MVFSTGIFGKILHHRKGHRDQGSLSNHGSDVPTRASNPVNGFALGSKQSKVPRNGSDSKARDISSPQSPAYPYGSRSLSAQVAAVKSLFPSQELPPASRRRSKSTDLEYLKPFSGKTGRRHHSAHVADHVLPKEITRTFQNERQQQVTHKRTAQRLSTRGLENAAKGPASRLQDNRRLDRTGTFNAHSLGGSHENQCEKVRLSGAEHSSELSTCPRRGFVDVRPHSICGPIFAYEERRCSLSRKPDFLDLRRASETGHIRCLSSPLADSKPERRNMRSAPISRAHLDKPLPPIPLELQGEPKDFRCATGSLIHPGNVVVSPERLESQVQSGPHDTETKVNTTYYTRWSPSVTHETITQRVHEIREEHITREIHNHHVYHRTLPIIDLEFLPPKHFVSTENGYMEVAEDDIPAELRPKEDWLRSETVSRLFPPDDYNCSNVIPQMSDTIADDIQECQNEDGIQRLESSIVHPQIVDPPIAGAQEAYTVRLNFGEGSHRDSTHPLIPQILSP